MLADCGNDWLRDLFGFSQDKAHKRRSVLCYHKARGRQYVDTPTRGKVALIRDKVAQNYRQTGDVEKCDGSAKARAVLDASVATEMHVDAVHSIIKESEERGEFSWVLG